MILLLMLQINLVIINVPQTVLGSLICSYVSVTPAICPSGWLSFSGSCYWLVSNQNLLTSWYLAQTKCFDMGANLLTIKK